MLNRLRRCQLSVPGSSQKMITKSSSLDVDVIVLDLEDAVAPSQKTAARDHRGRAILDMGHHDVDFHPVVRGDDLTAIHPRVLAPDQDRLEPMRMSQIAPALEGHHLQ